MKRTSHLLLLLLALLCAVCMTSCTPTPENVTTVAEDAPIYPDYRDVTIPVNIAPLNFLVRADGCDAVEVIVAGTDGVAADQLSITANSSSNEVTFDLDEWHQLLRQQATLRQPLKVTVTARINGGWRQYKPFNWTVVNDSIDPYLTYRLIEPDYEVFHHLEIHERCVENFEERAISTWKTVGDRCMNCHIHSHQHPGLSMMYVRGDQGGAVLNENGKLRKLDIKSPTGPSVYFDFSPTGRYAVFSTNKIIPAFHARPEKRLEVYDATSDIYVADLQENRIIASPLLNDSMFFETFPTFSPDGRYIYYCTARKVNLPKDIKNLQYTLCRIPFDEATSTIGTEVDTLTSNHNSPFSTLHSQLGKFSVCHPKISPDGRYLLYTVADYGTFPIWHREADLRMMDLQSGRIDTLSIVNSNRSDTYHSWSTNSRWFVFASKRDDGLYGKPYFSYVAPDGKVSKPFCLPQRSPSFYDQCLKSFNVPDLGRQPVRFDVNDVEQVMNTGLEPFRY